MDMRATRSGNFNRRPEVIAMVGQRFNHLQAVDLGRPGFIKALCDCGKLVEVRAADLRRRAKSCGCKTSRLQAATHITHGLSGRPEYETWKGIRQRCQNPNNPSFHHYGGRGITLCARWQSFENFLSDMGPRPTPKHTVERKNNDGNYEPDNCVWATIVDQRNNTRRNRLVTIDGVTRTVSQWARESGHPPDRLLDRLKRGWTPDELLGPKRVNQCG